MDGEALENFCNNLIKDEIFSILQENYAALYESARTHGDTFFKRPEAVASFKNDGKGLVSKGEIEAEKIIRERFKAAFPHFAIYGEELGDDTRTSEYTLVIDPVDGTSAMIKSAASYNPTLGFGITLGFLKNGQFWGGLIYQLLASENGTLSLGKTWSSWAVEQTASNNAHFETLISTAPEVMFTGDNDRHAFHTLEQAAQKTITERNCIGFMDILENPGACVVEADLSIHDAAAIIPILKNAGLSVTDHTGQDIMFKNAAQEFKILAAAPKCHAEVLKLYQSALKEKPLAISETSVLNAGLTLNRSKFNDE